MKLERLIVYRKVVRYLSFDFLQNLCYDINMRLLCYFCFIKCIKYESSATVINAYSSMLKAYEIMDVNNKEFNNLEESLTMFELMITKSKPELYLANKDNFYDFDNHKDNKDIKVKNYKSGPVVRFPVSK